MANKRLIGDDGKLFRATLGNTEYTSTTPIPARSWVKISAKATVSSFGALAVGEFFYNPKATSLTVTSGDKYYLLTPTTLLDLSGWSLELSGDEVEVTVMNDTYKKYRKGKLDAKGTASFVFIKGETDQDGNLANYFFKEVDIDATGAVGTPSNRLDTSLYMVGYLDDDTTAGETMLATIFEVEFFNFSLPENSSQAVKMDVPFRLIGDTDPILYRITNP